MSIESSRTSQGFIERFWEIGSSDNDDSFRLLESIELDQELIESLLHVVLFCQPGSSSIPRVCSLDPWRSSCFRLRPARR
jgi:hypothetical protein